MLGGTKFAGSASTKINSALGRDISLYMTDCGFV